MKTKSRRSNSTTRRYSHTLFFRGTRSVVAPAHDRLKLLARWQGPYKVIRQTGLVNYEIHHPDHQPEQQIYHVNLLKVWPAQECLLAEETDD